MADRIFFGLGDVVRLKSQHDRQMTVLAFGVEGDVVECVWRDNDGWHIETFSREALEFVRPAISPDA